MERVSVIFGTRPEAIKLCPLLRAMAADGRFSPHVCVTAQHRQMLDQVLELFEIRPDVDLNLMEPNQTLASLTARAVTALDAYLGTVRPRLVIVQGDTTTAFCASLAAYYHRIPVGHVEAGLRTWNRSAPFPEEINRVLLSRLADYHFAPTSWARSNLLREGVPEDRVWVTGNTVIDALLYAIGRNKADPPSVPGLLDPGPDDGEMVLITGHRREAFGPGFEAICQAIAELAARFPRIRFVYPVHLNPNVREPVERWLGKQANIALIEPLPYLPFVALMQRAKIILTDSGGVQEEAPSLGVPVLVMRDTTERPEGLEAGVVRLVGVDRDRIVAEASRLLADASARAAMAQVENPYGDGHACRRILEALPPIP